LKFTVTINTAVAQLVPDCYYNYKYKYNCSTFT